MSEWQGLRGLPAHPAVADLAGAFVPGRILPRSVHDTNRIRTGYEQPWTGYTQDTVGLVKL